MLPADINLVYICTIMARHKKPLSSPFEPVPAAAFRRRVPIAYVATDFLVCRDGRSQPQQKCTSRGIIAPAADAGKRVPFQAYEITVKAGGTYRLELSDCERYWLATIITPSCASKFRVFSDLGEAIDAGLAWARHQRAS